MAKKEKITQSFFESPTLVTSESYRQAQQEKMERILQLEGKLLRNRYLLEKLLGAGGMGRVFRAFDQETQRLVAIKVLVEDSQEHKIRFKREYKFLRIIEHPNLVKAYDYFEENDDCFIILEFVEGQTMGQMLAEDTQVLSLPEQISVANRVARVLEVLNTAGIIHRDIKPENIMINPETGEVKILDLGVGKDLSGDLRALTAGNTILGTLAYLSPEQSRGEVTTSTDIFSYGVVFYQFFLWEKNSPFLENNSLATLHKIRNFQPPTIYDKIIKKQQSLRWNLLERQKKAYQQISDIVAKAMAKDPKERWDEAKSIAEQLAEIQHSLLEMETYRNSIKNQNMLILSGEMDESLRRTLEEIQQQGISNSQAPAATPPRWWKDPYVVLGSAILLVLLSLFPFLFMHQKEAKLRTYVASNGDKYIGEFEGNQFHGQGTLIYANGDRYIGEFKNNQFHGEGILLKASGTRYEGEFQNGKFHGYGKMTYPSGEIQEGRWKQGVFVGE